MNSNFKQNSNKTLTVKIGEANKGIIVKLRDNFSNNQKFIITVAHGNVVGAICLFMADPQICTNV